MSTTFVFPDSHHGREDIRKRENIHKDVQTAGVGSDASATPSRRLDAQGGLSHGGASSADDASDGEPHGTALHGTELHGGEKQILIAAPRGYCAGVSRAVNAVELALTLYGAPVYVRKEIVHNKYVVQKLQEKGAVFVHELDEIPEGARTVFSAHGVSPAVRKAAEARHLQTIDATCPLVTKVHKQAVRYADEGDEILLIGHEGHEEVEGTFGEAPQAMTIVGSVDEARTVQVRDPEKVVWISQTTLSVDDTQQIVRVLRSRFPHLKDPISTDICYATQNRQSAVKVVAPQSDVMIVVGSANSSNSVRLAEVARDAGARAVFRVDSAQEINPEWVADALTVGVTSGASVPETLVDDVVSTLVAYGFSAVREVTTEREDIQFSLPKNLRADLKAAGIAVDRPHKVRVRE
ncbi:MAG: 4-hydroxy-3-methylbut-2-enyl diphosphate reductase [Actinomycetaceae bacterium]|nr:4-hydroxy-3-methylbut-2-enyl diphosphate reductase [Actinomycetaceae bacterium]MDY6083565.1 4-hydroxy-3-methylbut-2-enyl diphosphate reductase [Actinomycetaceae bacterium]